MPNPNFSGAMDDPDWVFIRQVLGHYPRAVRRIIVYNDKIQIYLTFIHGCKNLFYPKRYVFASL